MLQNTEQKGEKIAYTAKKFVYNAFKQDGFSTLWTGTILISWVFLFVNLVILVTYNHYIRVNIVYVAYFVPWIVVMRLFGE